MKRGTTLAVGALLAFAGIQGIRPERKNAPHAPGDGIEGREKVPPGVVALLRRSCYDCHSQEVRWPPWSEVAPASWLIASDVRGARRRMDFSRWDPSRARERLDGICELATTGEMPPARYTLLHPGTRLTKDEARLVCAWTGGK